MRKRLIQIFGFLVSSLGWLFVLCTMAMDFWRITQRGGQGGSFIIKVAWYWSNLWKDCFTDSTAVTNCRDFPVLWSVTGKSYVQGVRGLLMCGLTLGFFGVVLCFIGMDCTYIGGADQTKDKLLFAGAVFHVAGGPLQKQVCVHKRQKCFALRTPIFLGLVGCFLIILGAVFYAVTVFRVICPKRYLNSPSFPIFSLLSSYPSTELILTLFRSYTVKWYMPTEGAHTWTLAPEEEPSIVDTTNPQGSMQLTWAQEEAAAPRSRGSLRQHQHGSQREMHLCSNFNLFPFHKVIFYSDS
uniref:Claudin-10-like n=1 Tax=Labrus bergylta TaxID=56723 RepID=A0A3Q3G118_9LABR